MGSPPVSVRIETNSPTEYPFDGRYCLCRIGHLTHLTAVVHKMKLSTSIGSQILTSVQGCGAQKGHSRRSSRPHDRREGLDRPSSRANCNFFHLTPNPSPSRCRPPTAAPAYPAT